MNLRVAALFSLALAVCGAAAAAPRRDPAIERAIDAMADDEKIAQLMIVGFDGSSFTAEFLRLVRDRRVGGIVLYAANLSSPKQVRDLTASIARAGGDRRPFIAIDQEGGIVRRLRDDFPVLPSAMALGATRSPELARKAGHAVASGLRDLGFDMNFAPVLDVLTEPRNASIGTRAFSDDPALVASLGSAFIEGQRRAGVVSVVKHFPGLGGVADDTHERLPVLTVDAATLRKRELVPFRAAFTQELTAVMSGHVAIPALAGSTPASLSPAVLTDLLRRELRFDGVVISDALQMKALAGGAGTLALQTILAGSDMVLALGKPEARDEVFATLRAAYRDGTLPKERVRESLRRILALKKTTRASTLLTPRERLAVLDEIAARAVTIVGEMQPLRAGQKIAYVGPDGALRRALPAPTAVLLSTSTSAAERSARIAAATAAGRRADLLIMAAENQQQFELLRDVRARLPKQRVLFVNLGMPWRIMRDAAACTLLTYADDARSQEAAAQVILGKARATGIAPVTLDSTNAQ
jgi:beta-N-acetylhexosaminidase